MLAFACLQLLRACTFCNISFYYFFMHYYYYIILFGCLSFRFLFQFSLYCLFFCVFLCKLYLGQPLSSKFRYTPSMTRNTSSRSPHPPLCVWTCQVWFSVCMCKLLCFAFCFLAHSHKSVYLKLSLFFHSVCLFFFSSFTPYHLSLFLIQVVLPPDALYCGLLTEPKNLRNANLNVVLEIWKCWGQIDQIWQDVSVHPQCL